MGGKGPTLLGCDWLHDIRLDWASMKMLTTHNSLLTVHQLTQKYANVFHPGLDTIKKFKDHLQLKEEPTHISLCPVPFALKEAIEREVALYFALSEVILLIMSTYCAVLLLLYMYVYCV